jgi:hypothetical protein
MPNCDVCDKFFRDKYNLGIHKARKTPCLKPVINKNSQDSIICVEIEKSDSQDSTIIPQESINIVCDYCFQSFSNIYNRNRHNCKYKEDPVRQLEIELKIHTILPTCSTECRFCNKVLSRTDALNKHLLICQKRKEYYQKLLYKKQEDKSASVNELLLQKEELILQKEAIELLKEEIKKLKENKQPTVNVDTLIVINNFNEKPYEKSIEKPIIENMLTQAAKLFKGEPVMAAGDSIARYIEYMYNFPEYRNVYIKPKSSTADIYQDNTWKEALKAPVINIMFRKMGLSLYMEIDKNNITKEPDVIQSVIDFSDDGLDMEDLPATKKESLEKMIAVKLIKRK